MEGTGILENPALLSLVLPDFEPGPTTGIPVRRKYRAVKRLAELGLRVQFPPPPNERHLREIESGVILFALQAYRHKPEGAGRSQFR